jgi:restriction system protein
MARRKQGGFELIAATPWPVGIVLGILAYFGVRYGFTLLAAFTGNPILSRLAATTQNSDGYKMLAWMALGLCWIAALASFIGRQKRKRLLETQTGLDSLRAMNWRQFEMLVGEAFRRQGYRIEETGLGGADGGIDLRLSKDGKTTLVQCKQWRSQRVDVKVVREMYGLLAHHGADAVKIVAIGDFTSDAQRFAQGKPIELIHGEALLALIRGAQVATPGPLAAKPNPTPAPEAMPNCPSCNAPMVKRANRHTHEAFWGCAKYPACRGTRPA